MHAEQLRNYIVRPVLDQLALTTSIRYSEEAEDLLVLTACAESQCGMYVQQVRGPAQGIFQMEPATHVDLYENFCRFRTDLLTALNALTMQPFGDVGLETDLDMYNPLYAAAIARVHYYRKPDPLPKKTDYPALEQYLHALALYWKEHYNTFKGKGTTEKAVALAKRLGDISF